jgi:hypothetical protein
MIPGPNLRQTQMNPVDRIFTQKSMPQCPVPKPPELVIIGIVQVGRQKAERPSDPTSALREVQVSEQVNW